MRIVLATSLHLHHDEAQSPAAIRMMEFVPVGLLSLKAASDAALPGEADVRVVEVNGAVNNGEIANDGRFYEHLVERIARGDDDFVGLMTDADSLHHTVLIAEHVKSRYPAVHVCLGGPGATPLARPLLRSFPFIDSIVRGEGEHTFVELIRHLREGGGDLRGVLGLSWRNGDEVIHNKDRPLIDELDELPELPYSAYNMGSGAPVYLDVGRGCPFACEFCATAPFWQRTYRMRSVERIHGEMALMRSAFGRSTVNFSHDIFTCDRKWTHEFCDYLIENPPGVRWTCSTRTDIIDAELLQHMAEAGCDEIYFGIETGSAELQEKIGKKLDLERAHEIISATKEAGIRPVTGFIVGYPMETRRTFNDTLTRYFQFLETGGFRAHIFVLSPFAESPMYSRYNVEDLDRPARYGDLQLAGQAGARAAQSKDQHREIFSSTYRYRTPDVSASLIDGCEEVSAAFCTLRAVWRHVLPLFESPLEFVERWLQFAGASDEGAGVDSSPEVMLDFIESRLPEGEQRALLRALLKYERLKLRGRALAGVTATGSGEEVVIGTCVKRSEHVIVEECGPELQRVFGREASGESRDIRAVAVLREANDNIMTLSLRSESFRLWEQAHEPVSLADMFRTLEEEHDFTSLLQASEELVRFGILQIVHAA